MRCKILLAEALEELAAGPVGPNCRSGEGLFNPSIDIELHGRSADDHAVQVRGREIVGKLHSSIDAWEVQVLEIEVRALPVGSVQLIERRREHRRNIAFAGELDDGRWMRKVSKEQSYATLCHLDQARRLSPLGTVGA